MFISGAEWSKAQESSSMVIFLIIFPGHNWDLLQKHCVRGGRILC